MKYLITSYAFNLLFVLSSVAQVTISPRGGLAISTTNWEQVRFDTKTRSTITFGIGLEFELISKWKLQIESNYVSKGYIIQEDGSYNNSPDDRIFAEHEYEHNYIVLPILVKRYFGTRGVRFYGNVGPYFGLGLGGKHSGKSQVFDNGRLFETVIYDRQIRYGEPQNSDSQYLYYRERFEFGFTAGGGILVRDRVALDVRYEYGITSPLGADSDHKNSSFLIAVMFPISLN